MVPGILRIRCCKGIIETLSNNNVKIDIQSNSLCKNVPINENFWRRDKDAVQPTE